MKSLLTLIFIMVIPKYSFSAEFAGNWTQELEHELVVSCLEGELLCRDLCNKNECRIKQTICRDCIGTSIFMAQIFQSFTEAYSLTGRELSDSETIQFLKTKKLVSIETNSPFNVFDDSNSLKFDRNLSRMCGGFGSFPLLLGTLGKSGSIESLNYLVCHTEDGARVMELAHSPEVVVSGRYILLD